MRLLDPKSSGRASGRHWDGIFYTYGKTNVVREFGKPNVPRTPAQIYTSSLMTILSRVYSNDLTEGQRQAWSVFASGFVWTPLWGQERVLKALQLFQKINFPLIYAEKDLQLNPPPPISPSEILISNIQNEEGGVQITVTPTSEGEIASQNTFIDVWVAGQSLILAKGTPPELFVEIGGLFKTQAINPVKSDFRHRWFATEIADGTPPVSVPIDIFLKQPDNSDFANPTRLALLLRRYNKYGRYSNVYKISFVSTTTP